MIEENSRRRPFLTELKAIDPEVLATALGGNELPEEPIFKTFEEGFR
jgi:serine/threonine-protein kinase SRPK3